MNLKVLAVITLIVSMISFLTDYKNKNLKGFHKAFACILDILIYAFSGMFLYKY